MVTISITYISDRFMSDETFKENICTRLTCIDLYKIDGFQRVS